MKQSLLAAALIILPACASTDLSPPDHEMISISDSFVAAEVRLREAIGARNLTLFTVIDHGAGATSVGRDIGQSKLFIFGNPQGGTPLLEAVPEIGMDLPLKVLLYTDEDGQTRLSFSDIKTIAARNNIRGQDDRLDTISEMLRDVARETAR